MGIISLNHSDSLLWLGRYTERVYTTLRLFSNTFDIMIDNEKDYYKKFCQQIDIPDVYSSRQDFNTRYCFDKDDANSIYSNLVRAYDNAIVLREEVGSETISYIQLAIYDMEKSEYSVAPLIELQRVMDDILAFWGMINDAVENRDARNLIKTGKRLERLSLYGRLHANKNEIEREANRLSGRIVQTQLAYNKDALTKLVELSSADEPDYTCIVHEVENII